MNTQGLGAATYCPEDDKLRLYVGRVPRDEYDALRAEGWTSLHKQRDAGGGDFAAVWTPKREDTALAYSGGIIDDEDMGPQERAADRAERFSEYRDKREAEATAGADKYDSGPAVHGYQSQALAERRAARHDAVATRAVNAWDRAEYWQRRTAGVIGHALHLAAPGVRMGRIKVLEAEIRRHEKTAEEYGRRWDKWTAILARPDDADTRALAVHVANTDGDVGQYKHPRPECVHEYVREHGSSLWSLLTNEGGNITGHEAARLYLEDRLPPTDERTYTQRWLRHLRLRLSYENQMLEAQGGRLAATDIEIGGFVGGKQVYKVNKSPATGRVTSVALRVPQVTGWEYRTANVPGTDYALLTIDTERLPPGAYRPPTDEERAAYEATRKAEKAEKKATTPKAPPLVNPTDADAERLQAAWNENARAKFAGREHYREFRPAAVCRITQEQYSTTSRGAYAICEPYTVHAGVMIGPRESNMWSKERQDYIASIGPVVCKVRATHWVSSGDRPDALRVIVLTDKPQKALPAAVWEKSETATNGVAA